MDRYQVVLGTEEACFQVGGTVNHQGLSLWEASQSPATILLESETQTVSTAFRDFTDCLFVYISFPDQQG